VPIDVFAEYGAIGVVVVLFSYMIMNLIKSQKLQTDDLEEIKQSMHKMEAVQDNSQSVVIKLIDRFNKSDSDMLRKFDMIAESADRRHEKIISEMNTVTDEISYIKGRLNSKTH
jgi:hypothetical protein